jgi:hypothetical protein
MSLGSGFARPGAPLGSIDEHWQALRFVYRTEDR